MRQELKMSHEKEFSFSPYFTLFSVFGPATIDAHSSFLGGSGSQVPSLWRTISCSSGGRRELLRYRGFHKNQVLSSQGNIILLFTLPPPGGGEEISSEKRIKKGGGGRNQTLVIMYSHAFPKCVPTIM